MRTFFAILMVAAVTAHGATFLSSTNFALRTNILTDADLLMAENTNRASHMRTVAVTTANAFSNRTAYGTWSFPSGLSSASSIFGSDGFFNNLTVTTLTYSLRYRFNWDTFLDSPANFTLRISDSTGTGGGILQINGSQMRNDAAGFFWNSGGDFAPARARTFRATTNTTDGGFGLLATSLQWGTDTRTVLTLNAYTLNSNWFALYIGSNTPYAGLVLSNLHNRGTFMNDGDTYLSDLYVNGTLFDGFTNDNTAVFNNVSNAVTLATATWHTNGTRRAFLTVVSSGTTGVGEDFSRSLSVEEPGGSEEIVAITRQGASMVKTDSLSAVISPGARWRVTELVTGTPTRGLTLQSLKEF
jgi:hypothetical protein